MAYNYLDLTNEVLARFNEVELTASNFNSARGFQIQCKNAVNASIRQINQQKYGWPFNHETHNETLVAGTTRYDIPTNAKHVDYDTFRIRGDSGLNVEGRNLDQIDYKEYLNKYVEQEDETDVGSIPVYVFETPDNNYGLYPYPDEAYTLTFEYYKIPDSLTAATDVPTIPERFRHVIADGAVMYGFQFRGETQQYQLAQQRFEEGIKDMTTHLINRFDYVRSTVKMRPQIIVNTRLV